MSDMPTEWTGGTRDVLAIALTEYKDMKLKEKRQLVIIHRLRVLRRAYSEHQLGEQGLRTRERDFEPRFADIALMPEFRALVESSFDAYADVDADRINMAVFRAELANLPDLAVTFNRHRELALSDMMAQALGCPTWVGILDLAIAWFHCGVCKTYVRFPEVLAHMCQRRRYRGRPRKEKAKDYYVYDVAKAGGYHAWSANTLTPIVREDLVNLRGLVTACGLDPKIATAAEMDALDARVTCTTPAVVDEWLEGKQVMTWRRAVRGFHPEFRMALMALRSFCYLILRYANGTRYNGCGSPIMSRGS